MHSRALTFQSSSRNWCLIRMFLLLVFALSSEVHNITCELITVRHFVSALWLIRLAILWNTGSFSLPFFDYFDFCTARIFFLFTIALSLSSPSQSLCFFSFFPRNTVHLTHLPLSLSLNALYIAHTIRCAQQFHNCFRYENSWVIPRMLKCISADWNKARKKSDSSSWECSSVRMW